MRVKSYFFLTPILFCLKANAYCFNEAGAKYQIDPLLLRAIAVQESSLNARAINANKNKAGKVLSIDYGLMQVNSTHIPKLKRLGVIKGKADLLDKPCLNVQIGAWILAQHLRECGVNWRCLGTYNAGFHKKNEEKRMHYARRIYALYLPAYRAGSGT